MATIVAPPQSQSQRPVPRHVSKSLPAKRNIGAIEHDPVRFTRAPLLFAALAFAAGILITNRYWFTPAWLGIATLLEGLLAAAATRWKPHIALWPLATTWLLLGGFAAEMQPRPAPQTELRHLAQNEPVTLTGTIERATPIRRVISFRPFSTEQITEQMQSIDLHVRSAAEPGNPLQPVQGGLRLSLYAHEDAVIPPLGCGDIVTVTATIKSPERYHDPGVWDSPAWMLSQGIGIIGSTKAEKLHVDGHGNQRSLACLQHTLQTSASDRLMQFADSPLPYALPAWLTLRRDDAAMLSAMVTGDRSYPRHCAAHAIRAHRLLPPARRLGPAPRYLRRIRLRHRPQAPPRPSSAHRPHARLILRVRFAHRIRPASAARLRHAGALSHRPPALS